MRQHAFVTMAFGIGLAALSALVPALGLAQSPPAFPEAPSVPFGDTQFVLHAPARHCVLDTRQVTDEALTAVFFRPRAGKLNTYLGAFLDCNELTRVRNKQPVFGLSFGYYLATTFAATNPMERPRDQFLRGMCDASRARHGSLDVIGAPEAAKRELESRMGALSVGPPWFGPVVAEDGNGCYQVVLYKRTVASVEHRDMLVTINTQVRRRPVIYTRSTTYLNAWLPRFVQMVQSDVAAFVRLNP